MLGETVTVLTRTKAGTDEMGEPIYEWTAETVGNVLVRPLSGSDLVDSLRPDGIQVSYSLAFPKAWTAGKQPGFLAHRRVVLVARGMDAKDADSALMVSGSPDRTVPCPTAWDTVAEVGRNDG
nr:MAG TPA: head closure knob [Caudoviricetes sp.]